MPQAGRIRIQAFAKALVGHIHKGQQALTLDQTSHFLPLGEAQIGARRIVAATV